MVNFLLKCFVMYGVLPHLTGTIHGQCSFAFVEFEVQGSPLTTKDFAPNLALQYGYS